MTIEKISVYWPTDCNTLWPLCTTPTHLPHTVQLQWTAKSGLASGLLSTRLHRTSQKLVTSIVVQEEFQLFRGPYLYIVSGDHPIIYSFAYCSTPPHPRSLHFLFPSRQNGSYSPSSNFVSRVQIKMATTGSSSDLSCQDFGHFQVN